MNNNKIKFISLMQDIIFKTVWQSEDKLIKDYWNRLLLYIVGFDTSNYNSFCGRNLLLYPPFCN